MHIRLRIYCRQLRLSTHDKLSGFLGGGDDAFWGAKVGGAEIFDGERSSESGSSSSSTKSAGEE